ncbi:MAG TPA: heme ABC transporter permease CcmC [Phenylobacterium sp.]|jgi:heme exporter protein C|uniref:heme ABC transporter permease CcmC n=1 Tax=Phenylobacterium sp. TaxID=1871053 RepID=UPI002BBD48C7|nr:heme ABC transporter permease CcmC [Phenylobacterium sp.]HXA40872.1 heme ABC transporter permease CcmC [Phenylobacterium sp.]
MIPAPAFLTNPERFMAFSRWAAPMFGALALVLGAVGLWLGWSAPPDYQQSFTVRILFIHIPTAWMSEFVYACLAVASLLSLVWRQVLADAAAQAAAPLGAGFTLLTLATGALWGRPEWGTWWVWDARLTSELILFLIYLGYMALRASMDDEAKAARAAAILGLVGALILPVIHYSVYWWNTLHQGASVFRSGGSALAPVFFWPVILIVLAYTSAFGSLWLVRIRGEVWRRRAEVAALRAARG